jgi:serine/threonine-protein kinase
MDSTKGETLVGQTLGYYQVTEIVTHGALATVYKGLDLAQDRAVALKVLPSQYASEEFSARFRREAQVAARLDHPHILPVLDVGEHAGMNYIVMPYVDGGTLERRLRANPPPERDWALGIILQVCQALAYAHRQRVVHRDVKPSNILLQADGSAMLGDFGVARAAEAPALTAAGRVVGTAEYMAPEQGLGLPVDYRADMYATGIILYRVLTGRLPFEDASDVKVMMQHMRAPVPTVQLPNRLVADLWNEVLARALAKSPGDRYASMEDFATAIDAAARRERALAAEGGSVAAAAPVPAAVVGHAPDSPTLPLPPGVSPAAQAPASTGLPLLATARGLWARLVTWVQLPRK